jgi:hypothetical protein
MVTETSMIRPAMKMSAVVMLGCIATMASANAPELRCSDARVLYEAPQAEALRDVELIPRSEGEPDATQLEPAVATRDGTRHFRLLKPDTMKEGPWLTMIFIYEGADLVPVISVRVSNHKSQGVQPRWINEKLLHLAVFWGRIGSTEFILDIEKRKWIYAEDAHYGAMVEPCRD